MAVTVTPAQVAGSLTSFRAGFNQEFLAAMNLQPWREITTEYQSTGESETYLGLGTVPKMVDVTHDVLQTKALLAFDYNIPNLVWKAGLEVPRSYYEDEKLGLLRPKIAELGQEAARHPGELIFGLVASNPSAFDGVALIADTRTIGGSANIDNLRGYTVAAGATGMPTVAEFQTGLATARGVMRAFQDDNGRPLNRPGNVIMIPPEMEQVVFQALNAVQTPLNQPVVPSTEDGSFTASGYFVIVNPYLTEANDWYLIYARGGTSPFIYQTRIAPDFEPLGPGSFPAVVNDKFIFSVRARYNVGVGDPRNIVKVVGA